jgi:hypothetical protein
MAIHTQRNAFRDLAQYLVLAIPICNCLADRKILIFTIFVMKLNTCGIALTTRNACGSTFDIVTAPTAKAVGIYGYYPRDCSPNLRMLIAAF